MRLRNKPWAKPLIEANPQFITTSPQDYRGRWNKRFGNNAPLHIEIGMGKGQFIIEMAQKYPEWNFIGIEIQTSVAAVVLKKQLALQLDNLQLICANGSGISEYFEDGEAATIYLNFSDPWPKKRQAKRRLTYPTFLKQYQEVLKKDGHLEFKTDNQKLFEYSLKSMNNFGMIFDNISLDLHKSEEAIDNVMTEYEKKFSQRGQVIYKLAAHF
ncbi:tRNA (guanosine(46)-N7)-methyltransferase TrmB [Liquorilactobacillus capillatus]|uniref:tRNA (guanine-N(7)-)-methyltransferase n=1 Tax=Liquorilactobacillus capillatus DSM 19910 TaxID=1423731 RepID=A0A0R1MBI0_9LACO|nr:tRNA (guanosine(46)-N7)-methyltransferase TrmB [Liquorilactobacillus capillatus]KRL03188.1 tRNA (m(7)G46) methyltransferase [Liquorilactobacillus capillatus DSM 19910]